MYEIHFYRNAKGEQPVYDNIERLVRQKGKDSRIKATKIHDYIRTLQTYGTGAGEPYVKHLDGEIWELRPLRDRVPFAAWTEKGFILLHHYYEANPKDTQARN